MTGTIRYERLARDMYMYAEGISLEDTVKRAESGIRQMLQDTHLLATIAEHAWHDSGEFTLSHTGYEFNTLLHIWVRERYNPSTRLDPYERNHIELGDQAAILQFPDPDGLKASFGLKTDDKIHFQYSMVPLCGDVGFPEKIYTTNQRLCEVAVLKAMDSFVKTGNRHTARRTDYNREYEELVHEAKVRITSGGYGSNRLPATIADSHLDGRALRWLRW